MALHAMGSRLLALSACLCCASVTASGLGDGGGAGHPGAEARRLSQEGAPVARLRYVLPPDLTQPVVAWYNRVLPAASAPGALFSAGGHSRGYIGLQQAEERQGVAVFSAVGAGGGCGGGGCAKEAMAEIVECGLRAYCSDFGSEGTAYQVRVPLQLQTPYSFLVQAEQVGPTRVQLAGYFFSPLTASWTLLGKIRVAGTDAGLKGLFSSLERWDAGADSQLLQADFGAAFVLASGSPSSWTQIRDASLDPEGGGRASAEVAGDGWRCALSNASSSSMQPVAAGDIGRLPVNASTELPSDLLQFLELQRAGALPGGCAGGTCSAAPVERPYQGGATTWYVWLLGPLGLLLCAGCLCAARRRSRGLQRGVGPEDAGIRGEGGRCDLGIAAAVHGCGALKGAPPRPAEGLPPEGVQV